MFFDAGLVMPADFAKDKDQIKNTITEYDDKNLVGEEIFAISNELSKANCGGVVPTT